MFLLPVFDQRVEFLEHAVLARTVCGAVALPFGALCGMGFDLKGGAAMRAFKGYQRRRLFHGEDHPPSPVLVRADPRTKALPLSALREAWCDMKKFVTPLAFNQGPSGFAEFFQSSVRFFC